MKPEIITQEVLLYIDSKYCRREWCRRTEEDPDNKKPLSAKEQLENCCWDGMLPALLPEICLRQNNQPLTLWELTALTDVLHLKLGGFNEPIDPATSIQPLVIMDQALFN